MGEPVISTEPATGAPLWQGADGDIDAAIDRACAAWPGWTAQSMAHRVETVRRFANVLLSHEESLAELIARETGRPLWDSRLEVQAIFRALDVAVAASSERTGQRRLEGALGAKQTLRHKSHGVVAVITPFCQPGEIGMAQIFAALVAGNAVVWKPAPQGTATAEFLTGLFPQAGLPDGAVTLLPGGAETGQALALHDAVHAIYFTGSARNGIELNRRLATRPDKLLALQMGGNNALVVWDNPDPFTTAKLVVQSAFLSSGQNCTCARRLIVRDSLAPDLIAQLKALTDRLIVDEPLADPAPYMGPVSTMFMCDGLIESFLYLSSHGGKPVRHPTRPQEGLPFMTPGLIDMTNAAERPDVELFGPLLQIVRVDSFQQAIAEANATRYGLTASLLGGSPEEYAQFWSQVRAGVINWNRPTTALPNASPLGGHGISGNGRPSGTYMADSCAYPVSSSESEQMRASIGVGLRNPSSAD